MTEKLVKYIRMCEADRYRADGWTVAPLNNHHGVNGYAIASKEAPAQ